MLTIAIVISSSAVLLGVSQLAASGPGDFKGHGAEFWHGRYAKEHRALTKHGDLVRAARRKAYDLRRALVHKPSSQEAIRLASIATGAPHSQMVAVASCETGGTFDESADNPSSTASGLFQFLTSTFAATPYRSESIWSPYANALAAGWLWSRSRTWSHWRASIHCHGLR